MRDRRRRQLVRVLREAVASGADVVLTTGGTGLSPTDVTPEATRGVLERESPGIAEAIRRYGAENGVPTSVLSRGLAGTAGRTLIVNLPGSTGRVRDALTVLGPAAPPRRQPAPRRRPPVIGRLEKTVFDCPDPRAGRVLRAVLGMRVTRTPRRLGGHRPRAGHAGAGLPAGHALPRTDLADPGHPQQLHVDIRVEDVDAAERAVLAAGAARLQPSEDEKGFRVFADPAGHPFCLVF